jgi:hypothetical protein
MFSLLWTIFCLSFEAGKEEYQDHPVLGPMLNAGWAKMNQKVIYLIVIEFINIGLGNIKRPTKGQFTLRPWYLILTSNGLIRK